jgi:hypothetical protein
VTILARVVFALLIVATFSAFFVAQRLKSSPAVVDIGKVPKFFSPNGDGERDVEEVSFRVKSADDVTVDIVENGGGRVRRLAEGLRARPFTPVRLSWDGRTDDGARAPDGRYRLRIALRRSGRSVVVPMAIELDTTAPRPEVVRVRPQGGRIAPRGPAIIAPGQAVTITVRRVSRFRRTQFAVWRTDRRPMRSVATFESRRKGSRRGIWDGLVDGRPAPPGTYLIVPEVVDRAGNEGTAPAVLPPEPGTVPGRPGVLVRRLAVQPPLAPVRSGERATFLVDSRGGPYRWSVRRVGADNVVARGSGVPGRPLRVRAPGGVSGVFLFQVRSGAATTRVPFLVQAPTRARMLVVLPLITWIGEDAIDDDGDGLPNVLPGGGDVTVPRPLTGLSADFERQSAPLLSFFDRARVRYDVTTDLALAGSDDPSPTDREGVLLAGPVRYVPRPLAGRLRRYVERGGRLASFGVGSLRRSVTLTDGRLERATPATSTDAFGVRLRPVRRVPVAVELTTLFDDPRFGVLEGFAGELGGFRVLEESVPGEDGGQRLAAAVGEDLGERAPVDPETGGPRAPAPALTGTRLGTGLLIRVGLPEWSRRLGQDGDVQQITRNVLDLLRRIRPRPRSPLR